VEVDLIIFSTAGFPFHLKTELMLPWLFCQFCISHIGESNKYCIWLVAWMPVEWVHHDWSIQSLTFDLYSLYNVYCLTKT